MLRDAVRTDRDLNNARARVREIVESYAQVRQPLELHMLTLNRLDELGTMHEVYRYEAGHGSMVVDEVIRQTEVQLDFAARHVGTRPPD